MPRAIRRLGVSLLLCVVAAAFCYAGDDKPSWDVPHFSDDTSALYKAASAIVPAAGTDALILDHDESYVFDAQGRITHTLYGVFKILTQNGANQWSGISLEWQPWHQERPTLRARVITSDGVVHNLDPATISDAPAGGDEDDIYSDERVVRAPYPAIAAGSLVEVEYISKETQTFFDGGVVGRCVFGRGEPVQHFRLVLDAPASLPLRYDMQLLPDLKPEREEENGRVRVTFDHGPMDAFEEHEDDLPSDIPEYPSVIFSTGTSWKGVAELYGGIVDSRIAQSDLKPIVAPLIKSKKSREEITAALLQYVDRQVRYTGIEFGAAAITPHAPSETLKQRYGDCKDKATLLVAMLRAAGIPAYVALLVAGDRQDIEPDLPGMVFDHAIVYAPGAAGSPDLWIDATDERARLGELQAADQGRLALIARAETNSLTLTPVTSSQDNLLVEKREFDLAEYGPARVVEISEPHGDIESDYRYGNGDDETKDRRKQLADYVKDQYLADQLDKVTTSDATDVLTQFTISLETHGAKRGFTDLDNAAVGISLDTLFERLPNELQEREEESDKDKSTKSRTADYQLAEAFVNEWQYKIIPPAGFQPKPLPANATLSLGPASLTEEFSADADGTVHAVIRFDTVKSRFSVAEATEMRNQIAQVREGQLIEIHFEPVAAALLNEGKSREAFQAYRDLIALHPNEAVEHLRMANALLTSGMGEAARDEARLAVKLEPNSALAEKKLAEILEYDFAGRQYMRGSDYAGAEAAFRAAEKLDPDDKNTISSLAFLLGYNDKGEMNGPGASLKEAIAEYQKLTPEELTGQGVQDNPAFDLFYSGDFAGALKYAQTLNPQPPALIVASLAALNGSDAGIQEAGKRATGDDNYKDIAFTAGTMLMHFHQCAVAADLLEAGAKVVATRRLASILRRTCQQENVLDKDSPVSVVINFLAGHVDESMTVDKWLSMSSRNARKVLQQADPKERDESMHDAIREARTVRDYGLPYDLVPPFVMQLFDPRVEGSDTLGYRISLANGHIFFVVKEDGNYKILDSSNRPDAIGLEILDRIDAADLNGARVLLDWVREIQPLTGGDDALGDDAFPRIWTKGQAPDASRMKLAAAAILVQTAPMAQQGVSILESAKGLVEGDSDKVAFELALLDGYSQLHEYEKYLPIAVDLLKQYPESKYAFLSEELALRVLGRYQDADALAQERLKKIPDDMDAQRALVNSALSRGDYALAHDLARKSLNSADANFNDMNEAAWGSLFTGKVDEQDVELAIQAAQSSQNEPGILQTLGCIYAEIGKTKEARDVMIQAIDKMDLDEPSSEYYWYPFGRIAEQDGEYAIAAADYAQVTKPKNEDDIPGSTYLLAQNRLKILKSELAGGSAKN
jgi:tetratricopeptide (TPR) repeat protein